MCRLGHPYMCNMCACIHALVLHCVFSTCVHIELSMCAARTRVYALLQLAQHVCADQTIHMCSTCKWMRSCNVVSICVLITGTPLNHLVLVICPSSFTQLCATIIQTRTSCLRQGNGHGVCPMPNRLCLCPKDCSPYMPSWRPL